MAASPKETSSLGATVVGPSILINGKLSGDEDLIVRGRLEGTLSLTHTLMVEPSGIVKADVAVKNAVVSGVVVGNINATESVELTREGRMVGDIRAPRVIIADGASFRGRVDMGEVEPGRVPERRERPTIRPALRTVAPPPKAPSAAPARPAALSARPTVPAAPAARPTVPAAPARPTVPAAPARPPLPPPRPSAPAPAPVATKVEAKPVPPPVPPAVAAAAKKKVIIRKKGR